MEFFISASKIAGMSQKEDERKAMKAAAAAVFVGPATNKDKFRAALRADGDNLSLRIGADVPALTAEDVARSRVRRMLLVCG